MWYYYIEMQLYLHRMSASVSFQQCSSILPLTQRLFNAICRLGADTFCMYKSNHWLYLQTRGLQNEIGEILSIAMHWKNVHHTICMSCNSMLTSLVYSNHHFSTSTGRKGVQNHEWAVHEGLSSSKTSLFVNWWRRWLLWNTILH